MSFVWLAARALTRNPATAKIPDGANVMQGDVYDGQFYEHLAVMAYALKRTANVLGTAHLTQARQKKWSKPSSVRSNRRENQVSGRLKLPSSVTDSFPPPAPGALFTYCDRYVLVI